MCSLNNMKANARFRGSIIKHLDEDYQLIMWYFCMHSFWYVSPGLGYIGKKSDWLKGDLAALRGLWSDLRRLDLTQWRYLGRLISRESPEVSDGRQSTYIRQ